MMKHVEMQKYTLIPILIVCLLLLPKIKRHSILAIFKQQPANPVPVLYKAIH